MDHTELLRIDIRHLAERIEELEHKIKRLENTIQYQKKHSPEDGFMYWQVG